MCAWNEAHQRIEIALPFRSRPELFHAYELSERRVAEGAAIHSWSYGTRLGPCAAGQWSNMVEGQKQPLLPPALRKTNWRELLQILQASHQVGLPCSVDTDSSLGWPIYCHQSFDILLEQCLGAQHILSRAEGSCSKGSEAAKAGGLPRRALCGFCPCCTRAAHALIPATYDVG